MLICVSDIEFTDNPWVANIQRGTNAKPSSGSNGGRAGIQIGAHRGGGRNQRVQMWIGGGVDGDCRPCDEVRGINGYE